MRETPAALLPALRLAVRGLGRLPRAAQQRVAGPPVVIDGQRLEPEVQMILGLEKLLGQPEYYEVPVADARRRLLEDALLASAPAARLGELRHLSLAGAEGPLESRLYVPEDASDPGCLLVAFHGGGWTLGGLESHEPAFRVLARDSGVRVLSVDYRLAPEAPFPAAAEDALAAFRWAVEHAGELGVDPARIGVGGDSAGGNLSAVVARLAAGDPVPPAFQALVYPVTDLAAKSRSYELFRDGFYLSERQMDWYIGHYLADSSGAEDPSASPLRAPDLTGLAPAYLTVAGFDPLRDEGIAYAQRLREARVEVELAIHRGLIHGFINMSAVSRACDAAMRDLAAAIRARLGG
ncbi:MAG: alpha/beta hydrolase [Solirubrobacterales bacterium]